MRKLVFIALGMIAVSLGTYIVYRQAHFGEAYSPEAFRSLSHDEQDQYISSLSSQNPVQAWKLLTEAFVVDGKTVQNVHEFAHKVGNDLYKKYGFEGIMYCDTSFAYGCFHGVTEEGLSRTGPRDLLKIEQACITEFPPQKGEQYQSCIHGTGHGLLSFEGGDMTRALNDCDALNPNYRSYCYDGVFMENMGEGQEASASFDEQNPWGACMSIDKKYEINCARYQVPLFLSAGGPDPIITAGQYCSKAPQKSLSSVCYENLGYFVAQQSIGDAQRALRWCHELKDGEDECVAGAGIESVFQEFVSPEYSKSAMCDKIEEPWRSYCRNRIESLSRQ